MSVCPVALFLEFGWEYYRKCFEWGVKGNGTRRVVERDEGFIHTRMEINKEATHVFTYRVRANISLECRYWQ